MTATVTLQALILDHGRVVCGSPTCRGQGHLADVRHPGMMLRPGPGGLVERPGEPYFEAVPGMKQRADGVWAHIDRSKHNMDHGHQPGWRRAVTPMYGTKPMQMRLHIPVGAFVRCHRCTRTNILGPDLLVQGSMD